MRTSVKPENQPENYFLNEESKSLSIYGFNNGRNFDIDAQEFNEFVKKQELTSITFSKITEIPEGLVFPDSVKKIEIAISESSLKFPDSAPECKNLEELEISTCTFLEKLFPLSNFPNLKTLEISECPNLKTIPSLSNCKNLETVDLTWCNNLQLTDESIMELQTLEKNGRSVTYPRHLRNLSIPSLIAQDWMNSGIEPQSTNEAGPSNRNTPTITQRVRAGIARILSINCITPVVDQDQTPGTAVTRASAIALRSPDTTKNI